MEPIVFRKYDIYQLLFYCWFLIEEEINTDVCVYIIDYIVLLTKIRYTYFSLLQEANKYGGYVHSESGETLAYPLDKYCPYMNWLRFKINYREIRILFPTAKDMNKFHFATENLYKIMSTAYHCGQHIDITALAHEHKISVWLTGLGGDTRSFERFVIEHISINPSVTNESVVCSYIAERRFTTTRPAEKRAFACTLINL